MSQLPQHRQRWQIRRTFEANRLGQTHLEASYEKIVPIHIRVMSRDQWKRLTQYKHVEVPARREGRAA